MNRPTRHSPAGFGLVELLVAVSIFIVIIGAISVVFNGSLINLRQAEQNQALYEMVRGAMQVMERDLNGAFASREHGDVYQFYGTPIGFTFVGLVKNRDDDEPNLARVTYVLRRDSWVGVDRTRPTEYVDADGNIVDLGPPDPPPGQGFEIGADLSTFSLIRYVERNIDDIDSYPVDWTAEAYDDGGGGEPDTLIELIGFPENPQFGYGNFVRNAIRSGICHEEDTACLETVARAARMHLWIHLLAQSDEDRDATTTNSLPDILVDNLLLEPDDYVLIENIVIADDTEEGTAFPANLAALSAASNINVSMSPLGAFDEVTYNGQFFNYSEWISGDADNDGEIDGTAPFRVSFWNDWRNANLSNNGLDDDNDTFVDCLDPDELFTGPGDDTDGVDNDLDTIIDCLDPDELPISLMTDTIDNDGDGNTDAADVEQDEFTFATGEGTGSPLAVTLPQQVNFRFRIFETAPTGGASDFERNFAFDIDIPSGKGKRRFID